MAEHKLSGKDVLLFIDPLNLATPVYSTVVCLTKHSFEASSDEIDASSKCGPDTLPGKVKEGPINFDGQQLFDPASGKISGSDLFRLLQLQTTIAWKMAPITPVTGDIIKTGTGFISKISEDYDFNNPCTFSGTISIKGTVVQTEQV
jgi:hypothetical protein